PGPGDRERIRRHVVRDHGARAYPSVVTDLDRSNERIVDTGPDVPADLRAALPRARLVREVGGDVSGSHVRVLADVGVPDVGQVRHLCPLPDPGVLDLHECPRLRSGFQDGAGAKVTEWADGRIGADPG